MAHEINVLFDAAGLGLHRTLREMLDEHPSHRTERRGCGYTQATRFLSTYINQLPQPEALDDLDVFADWSPRETQALLEVLRESGWPHGWRRLDEAGEDTLARARDLPACAMLAGLVPTLRRIHDRAQLPESRILVTMIEHLLTRRGADAPDVPGMPVKPEIGSCSQAEEFFLEIAHGRVRRGGSVNTIVAPDGTPLMLEKMNLGESHSAIVVAPIRVHGVWIPPGGLCALEHAGDRGADEPTRHGMRIPLAGIARARFLRLTTLTLPPRERQRAFSAQIDAQIRSRMLSPTTTTLAELQGFARDELRHRAA